MYISETTTVLVLVPNEIDDILNEWIAEQRDPAMTKSVAINSAIREWLIARGALHPPGPLQQVDEEMRKLLEQAFPEGTPTNSEPE